MHINDVEEKKKLWYYKWTYIKRFYSQDMCLEWSSFDVFYNDLHNIPIRKQDVLIRKDNNKPYSKDNVIVKSKSVFTSKRITKYIYEGKTYIQWSKIFGIRSDSVRRNVFKYGEELAFKIMKRRYLSK